MKTTAVLPLVREAYLLPYKGVTRSHYIYQLDRWLNWCAHSGIDPLKARRADVERFIQHLQVDLGHKASSVHTALVPVRGFYRFAYAEEFIERDPAALARRPRFARVPSDTLGLDRHQMQAFLLAGESIGGRHYAAAYLLACMGLRATEACSIQVESFQRIVRGHRVLEFTGKAGVPARMPIPIPVLRALEGAAVGRTSGPLVPKVDGQPLGRQGMQSLARTIGRRAGIDRPVTPRLLRHSCITNALESGAPLHKVQDLARHADPRTTMTYARNRANLDDHAVHSLVAFLSPSDEGPSKRAAEAALGTQDTPDSFWGRWQTAPHGHPRR